MARGACTTMHMNSACDSIPCQSTPWRANGLNAVLSTFVGVLQAWDPALSAPIRDHLLIHQVLPALTKAVEAWEPRQETVPIHSWLHPWLPWIGAQLKPLYQPLRFKLARALEVVFCLEHVSLVCACCQLFCRHPLLNAVRRQI